MTEFFSERLAKRHDRAAFDCGISELDDYLRNQASQHVRRRVAAAFVLVPKVDPTKIAGYHTLSSASIILGELPKAFTKRLPRYPHVPAVLIGRLARDRNFAGTGIGKMLLIDALQRAVQHSNEVASAVVLVDAKNVSAVSFYQKYGFQLVGASLRRMYLPMAAAEKLVQP